jgi:DNA-binding transcriptional MerR regulator
MSTRTNAPQDSLRIHNVAAVTGVPEPTLRAWERRYGVPSPARTAAKYRLYTSEDVRLVREMRRLTESGVAANEAARRARSSKEKARSRTMGPYDPYAQMCITLVDAVKAFDVEAFESALREAMTLGSHLEIIDRVLLPTLRSVGDGWHAGQLSVAQEHFTSQRIGGLLRDLLRLLSGVRGEYVVLACVAKERHEIGLLSFGVKLAAWGYRPIFLGADVPPKELAKAIAGFEPALVGLAMTGAPTKARDGRTMIDAYAKACRSCPWIMGGNGAEAYAKTIRAHGGILAPSNTEVLRQIVMQLRKRGAA